MSSPVQSSKRVLASYILLALIPLFIGVSLTAVFAKHMHTEALRRQKDIAETAAKALGSRVQNLSDRLHVLTFAIQQGNIPLDNQIGLFSTLIASQPGVFEIAILGRSGKPLKSVPGSSTQEGMASTDTAGFKHYLGNGRQTMWISTQAGHYTRLDIYDRFSPVANVRVSLNLARLMGVLLEEDFPTSTFVLLDSMGRPILQPNSISDKELAVYPELRLVREALKRISIGASELMIINGKEYNVGYAWVPGMPVVMLSQQSTDEALALLIQAKRTAMLIVAMFSFVVWGALLMIVRVSMKRGVNAISE